MTKRQRRLHSQMGTFVSRYGRKTRKGHETTHFASRYMEERVSRMSAEEFDELLNGPHSGDDERREGPS